MRELRQAVVFSGLAAGLVLASACGSDSDGGSGSQGGGADAASGRAGSSHTGGAGVGNTGGAPSNGAAGSKGEAGSSERAAGAGEGDASGPMGSAGAGGAPDPLSAGGAAGDGSESGAGGAASVELGGGEAMYKVVFVTSTRYSGKFGGVAGADAQCQARALAAKLAGTYKAWLSASELASSPSARFVRSSVPYRLLDGSIVANDWADLTDGTLQHAISLTELHTTLSFFALTFTLADGTPGLFGSSTTTCYNGNNCTCDDWTNDQAQGTPTPGSAVGQDYGIDAKWTDYSFGNFCGGGPDGLSLYCFEQ